MDQIITFNKSFDERLEEYKIIFDGMNIQSRSEIRKQWSINLELELESNGWQAFWKIPRLTCAKLDIPYPTVVLVYVSNVIYHDLIAFVEIIAIQSDLNLSSYKHTTCLTKLWPTKDQHSSIDAFTTANALDKLRFFYSHIHMPWDYIEHDSTFYIDDNYEDRLRLYFDMKQGVIPRNKTVKIRSILADINNEFENFENEYELYKALNIDLNPSDTKLIDLHFKINDLKTEIELLQINLQKSTEKPTERNIWLVFKTKCTLNNYKEYLESIKYIAERETKFKTSNSLQNALESANIGDTIILNHGNHLISASEILEDGVILKSIINNEFKTKIDTVNENSFLEFSGESLTIENVTIDLSSARCGIIAHSGQTFLKNCEISGHSSAEHGIIILPGARITLENCTITQFDIGVYASANSYLTLINCTISNVNTAIKIFDYSKVYLMNCKFINYGKNCIYLESEIETNNIGNDSLLKPNPNINISDCIYDTSKQDGIIVEISSKSNNVFAANENF